MRSPDRQMMSSLGLRALAVAAAACLGLVELAGPAAFALDAPQATGLPIVKVLGCRLVGVSVVCDRNGKLLPNREKKLRKKEPAEGASIGSRRDEHKLKSSAGKSQSAASKSLKKHSQPATTPDTEEAEQPAPSADTAEPDASAGAKEVKAGSVEHSCPPGNVVLEKPNSAGSYCEPYAEAKSTPSNNAPADSGSVTLPSDIRAAACDSSAEKGACDCPGDSDYTSAACKAAIPLCCSAEVSADGKPQPVISRCGRDQNDVMNSLVSLAFEKKMDLGSVLCVNAH